VPLLARRSALLSGGEQQMLALAVALARAPDLLIIDELSFGLAPFVIDRLLGLVREVADRGAGVLLVEQHAGRALRHADAAVVLRRGEVALTGDAASLLGDRAAVETAYLGERLDVPMADVPRNG
jgi:ABC-type branched-subunit amino acid transport system ATPase component